METVGEVAKDLISRSDFLTAVGIVLSCVTIVLALGGIFAFLSLRRIAREEARDESHRLASEVAEKAAVAYLQEEMPALIREYMDIAKRAANGAQGDLIAGEEGREP